MIMISTRGRYALRVMIDIASNQGDGYVPMKDVAARQGLSLKYLEQIISILNKGKEKGHKLELKLPVKGVLLGIGAGIGQGVGLVLSKMGMNYYELSIPEGMDTIHTLVPFASTWVRALTGAICFLIVMYFQKEFHTLPVVLKDKKGMFAAVGTTISGPFIGVSLSLMAVNYTEAGIASTLMALTPIIILLPAYLFFKQKITWMEIIGAFISVIGVSLFFL